MNDFVQALSKQKKKESPARTPRETIRFYATFSFSLIAISGFSVLMFLVPFIVDPALATLTADFVEKPVECRVIFSRAILGNQKYLASFLQVCSNMQRALIWYWDHLKNFIAEIPQGPLGMSIGNIWMTQKRSQGPPARGF